LVVPSDRAQIGETVLTTARSPSRFVSTWGNEIFLVFVIAGGAIGLTIFATHVSKQDQKHADTSMRGGGMVLRFEILRVWLPQALVELAKHEPPTGAITTYEDLRRLLELRGQENVWYAMNVRGITRTDSFLICRIFAGPTPSRNSFQNYLRFWPKSPGIRLVGRPTGSWPLWSVCCPRVS
jgi:hypothetical protein